MHLALIIATAAASWMAVSVVAGLLIGRVLKVPGKSGGDD